MPSQGPIIHLRLNERDIDALLDVIDNVSRLGVRRGTTLHRAAQAVDKLDLQRYQQSDRHYEKCPTCKGAAWIEAGA